MLQTHSQMGFVFAFIQYLKRECASTGYLCTVFLHPKKVLLQPQHHPEAPGQPHSIPLALLYILAVMSNREAAFIFKREDVKGPEGSFPGQSVPQACVLQTDP